VPQTSDRETAERSSVKVLVQSRYREARVRVGRGWRVENIDGKEEAKEINYFRQFRNWKCYMTPAEAAFIVESKENERASEAGNAKYWYPAGMAIPVPDTYGVKDMGPFLPATEGDQTMADPRAAAGAKQIEQEKEAALEAARQKNATRTANAARKAAKMAESDTGE
jgi:hypothetical protein